MPEMPTGFPFGQRLASYEDASRPAREMFYPLQYALDCSPTGGGTLVNGVVVARLTRELWEVFFPNDVKPEGADCCVLNPQTRGLIVHGSLSDCEDYAKTMCNQ